MTECVFVHFLCPCFADVKAVVTSGLRRRRFYVGETVGHYKEKVDRQM
ncbi:hypothetical protein [Leminorella richardii]|nr:hypothetical protein [Leminorella richardii]